MIDRFVKKSVGFQAILCSFALQFPNSKKFARLIKTKDFPGPFYSATDSDGTKYTFEDGKVTIRTTRPKESISISLNDKNEVVCQTEQNVLSIETETAFLARMQTWNLI